MSSLNGPLTANTFGKKMPSVIIDKIEALPDQSGVHPEEEKVDVEVSLSISFTKPTHLQSGTVEDILLYNFSELYLYSYLVHGDYYVSDTWMPLGAANEDDFIIKNLENNNFSIGNWLTVEKQKFDSTMNGYCFWKIPFRNLLSDTSTIAGQLSTNSSFDAEGNEILTISGLKLRHQYFGNNPLSRASLSDTDLTYLCFVGLDDEVIFAESEVSGSPDYGTTRKITSKTDTTDNIYFGDIRYYSVLTGNKIPTKFFEAYKDPSGIPYDGPVLQSVNGNIYSAEDYSFDDIKNAISEMISEFSGDRSSDSTLNNNIESLEAIINATENNAGVLGELANYRSTYPNKSAATLSGEFYNRFIIIFQQLISNVESQVQLSSALLYDSLVVDRRLGLIPIDGVYFDPETDSARKAVDLVPGVPYTTPSDCFLPKKWFMLSRAARSVSAAASRFTSSRARFAEMFGDPTLTGISAADFRLENKEFDIGYEKLINDYMDVGMSRDVADELAREHIERYLLDKQFQEEATLHDGDTSGGTLGDARAFDIVVRNRGTFIFDYEKAIRTKSNISKIFNTAALELLMRYKIPYEYFYLTSTELSRNETRLDHFLSFSSGGSFGRQQRYIRAKLKVKHLDPISAIASGYEVSLPLANKQEIRYSGAVPDDVEASTFFLERLNVMRPRIMSKSTVDMTESEKHHDSCYLLPFNFDIANPDPNQRLKKYNNMDDAGTEGFSGAVGKEVVDGYRVIAYKFQDIMDDDIATRNTIPDPDYFGSTVSMRETTLNNRLLGSNNLGEARTCYSIVTQVNDRTMAFYFDIVNHFLDIYNNFLVYYRKAEDLCSYNNIRNEFNAWFTSTISEEFADKPWVAAAHAAVTLSQLIFGSGSSISESTFDIKVLDTIMKISPETGNLPQLQQFVIDFNGLLLYLTDISIDDFGSGPGADVDSPYKKFQRLGGMYKFNTIQFYNEKPIWEPIAGHVFSDTEDFSSKALIDAVLFTQLRSGTGGDGFREVSMSDETYYAPTYGGGGTAKPYGSAGDMLTFDRIYDFDKKVENAQRVWETVFWPASLGDLRYNFYLGRLAADRSLVDPYADSWKAYGGVWPETWDETVSGYGYLSTTQFTERLVTYLNTRPDPFYSEAYGLYSDDFAESGDAFFTSEPYTSMSAYFMDRIMRRSTMTNIVSSDGKGARPRNASDGSIAARSYGRNFENIIALLYLLKEANAWRTSTSASDALGLPKGSVIMVNSRITRDENGYEPIGIFDTGSYITGDAAIETINRRASAVIQYLEGSVKMLMTMLTENFTTTTARANETWRTKTAEGITRLAALRQAAWESLLDLYAAPYGLEGTGSEYSVSRDTPGVLPAAYYEGSIISAMFTLRNKVEEFNDDWPEVTREYYLRSAGIGYMQCFDPENPFGDLENFNFGLVFSTDLEASGYLEDESAEFVGGFDYATLVETFGE